MLGIADLVVHPGAHMGTGEEAGLARVALALDEVHRRTEGLGVTIDLETTAGQGTCLGHRFEHLRAILDRVASRSGWVFAWIPAIFSRRAIPWARPQEYDETIDRLDRSVGLDRVSRLALE